MLEIKNTVVVAVLIFLRILPGKTHLQIKLKHLSMNMHIWAIDILNQLFMKDSYTQIKFSKK